MMVADIACLEKPWVGTEIGNYNRKFAQTWIKQIPKGFGENGSKIPSMKVKELANLLLQMNQKIFETANFA